MDFQFIKNAKMLNFPKFVVMDLGENESLMISADCYSIPDSGDFVHAYKEGELVASFRKTDVKSVRLMMAE